jgi:NAD(P)-dependent dehydrogenase (short-subunit alcohol dehydrogenase family)
MLANPTLPQPASLRGRIVLVTGATSGLGLEAAAALAAAGADVIFGVRNSNKAHKVAEAIRTRCLLLTACAWKRERFAALFDVSSRLQALKVWQQKQNQFI